MDVCELRKIMLGMATYIPGVLSLKNAVAVPHGAFSPRYCYSVWLRHFIRARQHGLTGIPPVLAELGPGNSLGVGLAAMLTGVRKYWAFDVRRYFDTAHNLSVFDELVTMFSKKEALPDAREFPDLRPALASYEFPADLLPDAQMREALQPSRVALLRERVAQLDRPVTLDEIRYVVPWQGKAAIAQGTVDMVLSQAVMEHVEDLDDAYRSTFQWLAPGGIASHIIDFRCHGSATQWNGHWGYSRLVWKLIKGRKPFMINRAPLSRHLKLMRQAGFCIIGAGPTSNAAGIGRAELASDFLDLTDEDLTTCGAHVIARKGDTQSSEVP
jgi:hypothetical protein